MIVHLLSSAKYILNSSKTFLYVVAAYLVDSTFLSYFLKFDKTFAITPTEVNTQIIIGFKVTPPAAAPEMMGPAERIVRERDFFLYLLNALL